MFGHQPPVDFLIASCLMLHRSIDSVHSPIATLSTDTEAYQKLRLGMAPFHKWLPIISSFINIKITLANPFFQSKIKRNFFLPKFSEACIKNNYKLAGIYEKDLFTVPKFGQHSGHIRSVISYCKILGQETKFVLSLV